MAEQACLHANAAHTECQYTHASHAALMDSVDHLAVPIVLTVRHLYASLQ